MFSMNNPSKSWATALSLFASAACWGGVEVNGSFEAPIQPGANNGGGVVLFDYISDISGWTLDDGVITVLTEVKDNWEAADGNQFIEVSTGFGSSISQTINTVINQTYRLSFFYAANPEPGAPNTDDDAVGVNWGGVEVIRVDGNDPTFGDLVWTQYTIEVIATSTTTVLQFYDAVDGQAQIGGLVDNVTLTALVPEPSSALLFLLGGSSLFKLRRRG